MTPSAAPARRIVLVPTPAPHHPVSPDARLRRYRLARVTLEGRRPRVEPADAFRQIQG